MSKRIARMCLSIGAVGLLGVMTAGSATATPAAAPAPTCGGTTVYKSDGTPWVCTFDDEFNGTTLDTTKWTTWNYYDAFGLPNQCYFSDPSHLSVSGGYLNLTSAQLPLPQLCLTSSGYILATYGDGVVDTSGLFSQTYGRFEARIKFGGTPGVHDDFWLDPANTAAYPGQAELDVAEPFGAYPNTMNAVAHVTQAGVGNTQDLGQCTINNWDAGFHTYDVVWTATGITFSYDGVQCYSVPKWTPVAGYTYPAPFNQPFIMILQTALDGIYYNTVLPATTQVDYVRVWK